MPAKSLWLAAGLRTPFAKVDGPLAGRDAIALPAPVVQTMCGKLKGADRPELIVGATGARILSQAVKELAGFPPRSLAVVSICTDGGLGGVALLSST